MVRVICGHVTDDQGTSRMGDGGAEVRASSPSSLAQLFKVGQSHLSPTCDGFLAQGQHTDRPDSTAGSRRPVSLEKKAFRNH